MIAVKVATRKRGLLTRSTRLPRILPINQVTLSMEVKVLRTTSQVSSLAHKTPWAVA